MQKAKKTIGFLLPLLFLCLGLPMQALGQGEAAETVVRPALEVHACDQYSWRGSVYYASGTYVDSARVGDTLFVDSLRLFVHYHQVVRDTVAVCERYSWWRQDTPLHWTSVEYTQTGLYQLDTLTLWGCDSVVNRYVEVGLPDNDVRLLQACDSFRWEHHGRSDLLLHDGVYTTVVFDRFGCLHRDTLTLTVRQPSASMVSVRACDSMVWYGEVLRATGLYSHVLDEPNASGCDSVRKLNLTLRYRVTHTFDTAVCDSIVWHQERGSSVAGDFDQVFPGAAANGCDSVLQVKVRLHYSSAFDTTVYACDSFAWEPYGRWTASGLYRLPTGATNAYGCDSLVALNLSIGHARQFDTTLAACDSLLFLGTQWITTSGDHLQTTADHLWGCDSVTVFHLQIHHAVAFDSVIDTCDYFAWHGRQWQENTPLGGDTIPVVEKSVHGCDSADVLHLTLRNSSRHYDTLVACHSATFGGITYTSSNDVHIAVTGGNSVGCDSSILLAVRIFGNGNSLTRVESCTPFRWLVTDEVYETDTVAVHQTVVLPECPERDTLVFHRLYYDTVMRPAVDACGQYTWCETGLTFTADTIVYFNFTARWPSLRTRQGCDSVVGLRLSVHSTADTEYSGMVCDTLRWRGALYTRSGDFRDTLRTLYGCDSIVLFHGTYGHNSPVTELQEVVCDSLLWHGTILRNSGIYRQVMRNREGCDSLLRLDLQVYKSGRRYTTVVACDTDRYEWNNTIYTTPGVYTANYLAGGTCLTIDTLDLRFGRSSVHYQAQRACDSFAFDGRVYYHSRDIQVFSLQNRAGCDSASYLRLKINRAGHLTLDTLTCQPFAWLGHSFVEPGLWHDTVAGASVQGCDSTIALTLRMNRSESHTTLRHCGPAVIDGAFYKTDTVIPQYYKLRSGCDSVVRIHLVVLPKYDVEFDTLAHLTCEWHGERFVLSGDYTRKLRTVDGCDSMVTMHLELVDYYIPLIVANTNRLVMLNHYPEGVDGPYVDFVEYRWYHDGKLITGATGDSYGRSGYKALTGCYYLEVPIDAQKTRWVQSNTICFEVGDNAIDNPESPAPLALYPNPARSGQRLTVESPVPVTSFLLYNTMGVRLASLEVRDASLLLPPLPQGAYLLLPNGDARHAVRLLVY